MKSLSRVRLFATPWTVVYQAPLYMGFSRQEYWRGCHCLLQKIFATEGLNPGLQHCRQMLYCLSHWWEWGSATQKTQEYPPTTACPKWNSRKGIDMRSESKVWALHHCSTLPRRRKLRPKRWIRSHVMKGLLECGGSLDFITRVIGSHTRFQPGEETLPSAITLHQTPMVKTLC